MESLGTGAAPGHAPTSRPRRGLERSPSYPAALLALFLLWSAALALHPNNRADWLLENALVLLALPLLALAARHGRLSNTAWTLVFAFLALHEVGAHYTYSLVPYDEWVQALTGRSLQARLGWQRNHYDRLLHFLYGLLLTLPFDELLRARTPLRGAWRYILPVSFVMSHSLLYELVEWLAAAVLGGDLGQAYLGTQGDVWDAHRDMALASLGSMLAMGAIAARAALARAAPRDSAARPR
jgi:putative membrane protein